MRAAILTFIFLTISGGAASAASFCVEGMGIPPQCLYEDIVSCTEASAPPNTSCGINPTARLYYYGSSRYCAVESNLIAQCVFNDMSQCYQAVFEERVVCLDRDGRPDKNDPFRYDQRVKD